MNFSGLTLDPTQQSVAMRLEHIAQCLCANQIPAKGLYLTGPVGRGKTMLVDHFYQSLTTPRKVRLHFHHFMKAVHNRLAELSGRSDPLYHIALGWAEEYQVLCLDEFMVEDIADAMLLGTLWRHLFELDVILVTTSNTAPQQLYWNGLQRARFLPAIELIEQHCEIFHLDHGIDYRRAVDQSSGLPFFTTKHGHAALCAQLLPNAPATAPLQVLGRPISVLGHSDRIAVFDFWQLCSGPRSQRDYMELATQFEVIALVGVPCFSYIATNPLVHGVDEHYYRDAADLQLSKLDNEARRFMALVDECYDRNCLVIVDTADAEHAAAAQHPDQLYHGVHLRTPFERCASRLIEMQAWSVD